MKFILDQHRPKTLQEEQTEDREDLFELFNELLMDLANLDDVLPERADVDDAEQNKSDIQAKVYAVRALNNTRSLKIKKMEEYL